MPINTAESIIKLCYSCGGPLEVQYDYACPMCARPACDNDSQICQVDSDCDVITCYRCVEAHIEVYHPTMSKETGDA